MAISAISGAGTESSLGTSRKSIADNFDTFLTLLTTQLKHQNPLDPLDTNAFTEQLVQFTSVEQQLKTNEYLEALVLGNQAAEAAAINASNQAVSMIGKTVVASSTIATLKDDTASWIYTASASASNAEVTIRDSSGKVVHTKTIEISKGQHTFIWDGKDSSGYKFDDGNYSVSFSAQDVTGAPINVLTQVRGPVDTVDLTGSEPVLMIGGARIYLGDILSVTTLTEDTSGDDTGDDTGDDSGDDTGDA